MTNKLGDMPTFPSPTLAAMQAALPEVSAATIRAISSDVPGYRDALDRSAQATLAQAVELALRGFLALTAEQRDPSAPLAPAQAGAYALGRGEARAGRTLDALLAAYRVGARVAWRGMAGAAADAGLSAEALVQFAEMVFAYIDQLSAASVAGHADEIAAEDRVRQRHLERLGHGLLVGVPAEQLQAEAERARWTPPDTMAAVLLAEGLVDDVLLRIDPRTLQPVEDVPGLPAGDAVVLVPDPADRLEPALRRALRGAAAVVGPAVPWQRVRHSYTRALRARTTLPADGLVNTDDVLAELVVAADREALADLRSRALRPLAGQRPATAARLAETLRAWLLHRGQRDRVAAELFVHPQTVRYRVGQLRALFGDALDDPRTVLELTIALAVPEPMPNGSEGG